MPSTTAQRSLLSSVIWLAFTSDQLSPLEITELINHVVKPRLQTVPGVGTFETQADETVARALERVLRGAALKTGRRT